MKRRILTQVISAALLLVVMGSVARSDSPPPTAISLGVSSGKSVKLLTNALTTVAVTADQVVQTYTVTAGKTLYLQGFEIASVLSAFAVAVTDFGSCSLESPAGTKLWTQEIVGPGQGLRSDIFAEPIPVQAGVVVRLVCTPTTAASRVWRANFFAYEK
jgi:hypothetical protein